MLVHLEWNDLVDFLEYKDETSHLNSAIKSSRRGENFYLTQSEQMSICV